MKSRICPLRRNCWDKGDCENCDLGVAFEKYHKKVKRLKADNEKLKAENEVLRQRLLECENGYEQTLYLERLQHSDTVKVLGKLLYDLRTNMTSVTRYVRHKDGKNFEERHKEYLKLAEFAVDNILKSLNENEAIDNIFRKSRGEQK